mmetsp:Transcript_36469/g.55984  ORF Transcript_36469/g.55984 Transcript_36469/m.55984 type:complete len:127 (-) Transcript_36469:1287-1667(-)
MSVGLHLLFLFYHESLFNFIEFLLGFFQVIRRELLLACSLIRRLQFLDLVFFVGDRRFKELNLLELGVLGYSLQLRLQLLNHEHSLCLIFKDRLSTPAVTGDCSYVLRAFKFINSLELMGLTEILE